jgi:hypothetical protein
MYGIIILLSLLGGGNPPNNAQQKMVNVDSLFAKNINNLESIVNDSTVHVLKDKNLIDFMWMISLIRYKDIVVPHKVIQIDKKTISSIKQWYIDNKQYITPRNVEKAYNLMYPPPFIFESYETWMEWMNKQYDGLEIEK